ncbi:hypothetical protein DENIS_4072 [Desulfonema ishimotonii]|uniref:Serine dehydrogenase proteinase n=1 Tax=Desulfonema ishimotonii TaxID=45657 RepID=A0A401G1L8_9BACT|nr:hypothetical protein [Desulfonema ishimotonii]GBC63083.1 hypothetical protein DENIS_4072 [Desulfonema ishimotonii]
MSEENDAVEETEEIEHEEKVLDNINQDEKTYDLSNFRNVVDMVRDEQSDDQIKLHIGQYLSKKIKDIGLDKYRVIILYDNYTSINTFHSDKIYRAISDLNKDKEILLILQSGGGKIEPAYLISKTCKRLCTKFIISIPRRAKSAATLISLGADELHMGLLSELGPIDPQFDGFPASGLANAMEKIAEMTSKFPKSSEMFARYLTDNLDIKDLGYFERVNESAIQYAERLLSGKTFPEGWDEHKLANHLTNHYKDHGFVIDSDEANNLLGKSIIKENTIEYEFGNQVYEFLDFLDLVYSALKEKKIRFVGSIYAGLDIIDG